MNKETFYYNDKHYSELCALMEDLDITEENLAELEEDWTLKVEETDLEPMFTLDADWICERLDEERMSEDGDEADSINELLKTHIDFTKINELMPKLYYPNNTFFTITKKDLIEYCK